MKSAKTFDIWEMLQYNKLPERIQLEIAVQFFTEQGIISKQEGKERLWIL